MKKVLFIAHSAERSGATVVLLNLMMNLNRARYDCAAVFPECSELTRELSEKNIRVRIINNPQVSLASQRNPLTAISLLVARIRYTWQLIMLLRKERYHLVYINSLINVLPGIAALLARMHVIWHIHETFPPTTLNRFKAWLVKRCAEAIIFASPTCAALFEPVGLDVWAEFIPNGIAIEPFLKTSNPLPLYEEFGLDKHAAIITTLGYVHPIKGIDVLLRAAPHIVRDVPGAHFLIVGDRSKVPKEYNDLLETIIRDYGLGTRVTFAGMRYDIPRILALSSVFVLPSRMESFPLVLLEAMAAGKAIVATRVGYVKEILDSGKAGSLVAKDNAEALARAIVALLKDTSFAEDLANEARNRVIAEYSLQRFLERVQRVMDDVSS